MPAPYAALLLATLALSAPLAFAEGLPVVAFATATAFLALALPRSMRAGAALLIMVQIARIDRSRDESLAHAANVRAHFLEAATCTAVGRVDSAVALREEYFRFELRVVTASCDGRAGDGLAGERVRVTTEQGDLRRGDSVSVAGSFAATRGIRAPWEPSAAISEARGDPLVLARAETVSVLQRGAGFFAAIDDARRTLRTFFLDNFEISASGLLRALVLAEVDLPPRTSFDFKRSGLSHVLAVSGMHLTLVAGAALHLSDRLLRRIPGLAARIPAGTLATVPAALAATVYAALTGFGGSSLRALTMLAAHAFLVLLGRRPSGSSSLAASSFAVGLIDPLAMTDLSTALSVAATAALILLGTGIGARLRGPAVVTSAIGASLAATLGTIPVLVEFSLPIPLFGVLANLLAVPLGELVALPFALAGSLLVLCKLLLLAKVSLAIAAAGLALVAQVAHATASVPGGVLFIPQPCGASAGCALVAMAAIVAIRPSRFRRRLVVALVVMALGAEGALHLRPGLPVLRVTHLDVGQGDATVLEFPGGPLWLVDGGGLIGSTVDVGDRVVVPALVQARRSPDVVILSHPHPDHFGGLAAVLRDRPPKELWDTGQGEHEVIGGRYAELLDFARAKGIRVRRPDELCGAHAVGGAVVEVVAPCASVNYDRGPNDNSFVIRVRYGERSVLLTGDAEEKLESELVGRLGSRGLASEVLKVGHHGSRTSTTATFLAAVHPQIAVVSAGHRNRFGHPHAGTLQTLASHAVSVFRTDDLGTLREETSGISWTFGAISFSDRAWRGAW